MDLVKIDVVHPQPRQTVVDRLEDVLARQAALVRAGSHGLKDLGGHHGIVTFDTKALQGLAENELAFSARVHIRGIEEVDA